MKKITLPTLATLILSACAATQEADRSAANASTPDTAPGKLTVVDSQPFGEAPSGRYPVVVEHDPTLATHTIYRPENLGAMDHPIVVWGEGACEDAGLMFPEYLSEIASHGFVVIADGPPRRSRIRQPGQESGENTEARSPAAAPRRRPAGLRPDGTDLIAALDWIIAQHNNANSRFHQKLNPQKVAAMGMSCGGLMAYGASSDPRITTVGIWNSGLLQADQDIYDNLHSSVIIVTGGESDMAYPNGKRDFEVMPEHIPVFYTYYPSVGHFGTYTRDNGGAYGKVAVAWLKWQLLDDTGSNAKGFFTGDNCQLCQDEKWVTESRSLD